MRRSIAWALVAGSLSACVKPSSGDEPAPPAGGDGGEGTIGSNGGRVELEGVAALEVPQGALDRETTVRIEAREDPHTREIFRDLEELMELEGRLAQDVRIDLGAAEIQGDAELSLEISIPESTPWIDRAQVFARVVQGGDEETIEQFVRLPSTRDGRRLSVRLPWWTFDAHEAVIVVAPATEEQLARALTALRAIGGPLVRRLEVRSPFGDRVQPVDRTRRRHWGADLVAPFGTPVVAAADGVVTARINRGGLGVGYGQYAILRHDDGASTLYAHLEPRSVVEGRVEKGQIIARTGNTGGITGPHLHFEVVASGGIIASKERIDPMPLIEILNRVEAPIRQLIIGDRADLAATEMGGGVINRSSRGEAISLSTLVWRSSAPGVVNVDDRGEIGALAAGQATITAEQGYSDRSASIELTVREAQRFDRELYVDWRDHCIGADSSATPLVVADVPQGNYRVTALESAGQWSTDHSDPTHAQYPGCWGFAFRCEGLDVSGLQTIGTYPSAAAAFAAIPTNPLSASFAGGELRCSLVDTPCADNEGGARFRLELITGSREIIDAGAHHLGDGEGSEGSSFERAFRAPSGCRAATIELDFTEPFGPNLETPPFLSVDGVRLGSIRSFFPPLNASDPLWQTNGDGSHDYNGTFHVSLLAALDDSATHTFRIENGRPDDDYGFANVELACR
jgi:murein DD-endopeptidase MepM/ murein hydrolase activator NlpD